MGRYKVYIKTFGIDGEYQDDFIDISDDVVKMSAIQQGIDNTDFDVGTLKNSNFKLTLRNDHGKYGEPTSNKSIFVNKKKNSIVKVTYNRRTTPLTCGFFKPGREKLGFEYEIYRGILYDIDAYTDIDTQQAIFSVLGFESLFKNILVPYADISIGETYSSILYKCLNQSPLKDIVTVDAGNINPGNNLQVDKISHWEGETLDDILDEVMTASSSVIYIQDSTVYVKSRDPSASVQYTFYGQASIEGIENIINIPTFKDGVNRVFNYWKWEDSTLVSSDASSIGKYNVLKKEISAESIDNASTSKITSILEDYRDNFKDPKIELTVETPVNYSTLELRILDKVLVEYPTVFQSADNNPIPRYGVGVYGQSRYPFGRWTLTLSSSQYSFKILNFKIDPSKNIIQYLLREI